MAQSKAPYALPTWFQQRRFSHDQFSLQDLGEAVERKQSKVTVVIPAREVAETIAGVIDSTVQPLLTAGVVSRLVVIDAASKDGTGAIAAAHGAEVIQRKDIAAELGPSCGKGDALWRALLVTDGDIVAFLDGDTGDPSPAHLIGILGPLILHEEIQMTRACFDRPFKTGNGEVISHDGGRVTEILARPLLNSFWPDLAGFSQPLAGEFAGRRALLEKLPFPVSYGIEIGTLIDTYNLVGLGGMAQVDVGRRQNAHQPLRKLTVMAQEIMCTAMRRSGQATLSMMRMYLPWNEDYHDIASTERPPVCEWKKDKMAEVKSYEIGPYPGTPFVNISGVRMFRDIGGYQSTEDGRSTRCGLVFRSGEPSKMTPDGQVVFKQLGIRKVFDLRSDIEIKNGFHDKRIDSGVATPKRLNEVELMFNTAGIERIESPVFPDEEWLPQQRDDRLKKYASAAEGYAEAYKKTLIQGASAYRLIFQHLAEPNPDPILVHCSAGKDRTGVISMLLLALAGCNAATIAFEYALNDLDADWRAGAVQRLLAQPGLNGNVQSATNVVRARSDYMLATFEMLERDFGGVKAYLRDWLELSEQVIGAVKANLLAN
ncbi:hypothetical protein Q7P37_000389 [Cladosporium fusiforme]